MAPRRSLLSSLASALSGTVRQALRGRSEGRIPAPTRRTRDPRVEEAPPGRYGADATVEVDPHRIGPVRMTYHPNRDGDPDPGEIVWTWVPFEENDGRGKDRPVLVVAAEQAVRGRAPTVLAVQLTSKDHSGDAAFVAIGSGSWDGEHRPSWVNIDRVMRVHPTGMRREAAALDEKNYVRVESALRHRYGWR
jgi:hypothetical protein